jgi:hypothetical protein
MTSQKHNNHKLTQFWFGFALGSVAIGAGAFLFGTKKGRSIVKRLVEYSENLEENLISLGKEYGEEFGTKVFDIGKKIVENKSESSIEHNTTPLGGLLEKMKGYSGKKVFLKSTLISHDICDN